MSVKGACQACHNTRALESCVGCGRSVCEACRGDESGGYWSAYGKKGYGCSRCIHDSVVYEGGTLGSVNNRIFNIERSILRLQEYLTAALVKDIQAALNAVVRDALGRKSLDEYTGATIREAESAVARQLEGVERHATKLVEKTRDETAQLARELVKELSIAVAQQRAEVHVDVKQLARTVKDEFEPIAEAIRRETDAARRTAMWIGVLIALANFLGIWIGSLAAQR